MTTEYQAGIGGSRGGYPGGRTDPYPNNGDYRADPRTDPYPNNGDYRGDRGPRTDSYGNYANSTDLRQLAAELDQRAARASQLSTGYAGYGSNVRQFAEQARNFRDQVESNRMSRSELRNEVNQLLNDAQSAYSELRQRNVSREVADEWDAIVQILNRMRDLAV
jgi:methyl-accepting chemotaxis protein